MPLTKILWQCHITINYRVRWAILRGISVFSARFERNERRRHSEFVDEACGEIRCTCPMKVREKSIAAERWVSDSELSDLIKQC